MTGARDTSWLRRRRGPAGLTWAHFLIGFVVGCILAGLSWGVLVQDASADTVSQLDKKLRSVKDELREVRENIAKASLVKKAALGDITALDKRISQAEKEVEKAEAARDKAVEKLNALREQLQQLNAEMNSKQRELEETEEDLADQQRQLEQRLVEVYKADQGTLYLEVLLSSASISDVLGRARVLGDLIKQDNDVLSRIRTLKAQIEAQKQALEEQRARVSALEAEQKNLTLDLQQALAECEASLKELQAAREAKQRVLLAAQKDEAAWRAQEDALLSESKRIAELLRKARAAAAAKTGKGVLSWPVAGPVVSGYGYRIHPIFHVRKMHTGIDIDASMGSPINAAAAGTVVAAGWRGGYGKCVILVHSGGLATLYGHLSVISVEVGQTVKKGQTIGKVGSTGYSTGPHLHFEVRVNGDPVNPMGFL
ncbi:MAG: peptidoglycan DD-metalloendopeptidase family protein [Thermoleophilia bacterium]|nr:peptidoglycan DD-metalloendopeptidase family protein [Thermoleophilia bacterium]